MHKHYLKITGYRNNHVRREIRPFHKHYLKITGYRNKKSAFVIPNFHKHYLKITGYRNLKLIISYIKYIVNIEKS